MLFILNIGNTNTQYALYDGHCMDIKTCPTAQFSAELLPKGIPVAAVCVVPAVKEKLKGYDIFYLSADKCVGMDFSQVEASAVGADRLANAVMLAYFSELPAVCIDCGTAITFEVVDEKKAFRGGAILPGRFMLRKGLHEFTAQLPLVEMEDRLSGNIGENTREAIRFGVDRGSVGMIKEILASIKAQPGFENCSVLLTGGDALFFTKNISGLDFAGFDYTLRGIAKAWELNNI